MPSISKHKWTFRARFRRHAFGWRSQPAIKRIKEAVSEIKNAGCKSETFKRICELVAGENFGECFVTKIIGHELGLK